jgi:hypothetical protein
MVDLSGRINRPSGFLRYSFKAACQFNTTPARVGHSRHLKRVKRGQQLRGPEVKEKIKEHELTQHAFQKPTHQAYCVSMNR